MILQSPGSPVGLFEARNEVAAIVYRQPVDIPNPPHFLSFSVYTYHATVSNQQNLKHTEQTSLGNLNRGSAGAHATTKGPNQVVGSRMPG